MRWVVVLLAVSLAGCERVSEKEMEYVGRWTWDVEVDEFREFGFLELRKNRTYSYHIEMVNPTETLVLSAPDKNHYSWWLSNGAICISSFSSEGSLNGEECLWHAKTDSNGSPFISMDGGMTGVEMVAVRDDP